MAKTTHTKTTKKSTKKHSKKEESHDESSHHSESRHRSASHHSESAHHSKSREGSPAKKSVEHHSERRDSVSQSPARSEVSSQRFSIRKVERKKSPPRFTERRGPHVTIRNVEKIRPAIPEGVNSPRSVHLCEKSKINPAHLAPRTLDDFKDPSVTREVAEIRLRSYENRRKAHMEHLLPKYEKVAPVKVKLTPEEEAAKKAEAALRERSESRSRGHSHSHSHHADHEHHHHEHEDEHEHEQEHEHQHRATSGPRKSRSAAPPSQPLLPSEAKILSRIKRENREPTEGEIALLNEIRARELRRMDARDRAAYIEESKELAALERTLEVERRADGRLREKDDTTQRTKIRRHHDRERRFQEVDERLRTMHETEAGRSRSNEREESPESV